MLNKPKKIKYKFNKLILMVIYCLDHKIKKNSQMPPKYFLQKAKRQPDMFQYIFICVYHNIQTLRPSIKRETLLEVDRL